jgi:hypothetical protein
MGDSKRNGDHQPSYLTFCPFCAVKPAEGASPKLAELPAAVIQWPKETHPYIYILCTRGHQQCAIREAVVGKHFLDYEAYKPYMQKKPLPPGFSLDLDDIVPK